MSKTTRIPVVKRPAKTVSGVLRQSIRLLDREAAWIKGRWFGDGSVVGKHGSSIKPINPEEPLCSQGWGSCAEGMVQAVIFGVPVQTIANEGTCVVNENWYEHGTVEQFQMFNDVKAALDEQVPQNDIMAFNDDADTTRSDVLAAFRKAYRRAQYTERLARTAA